MSPHPSRGLTVRATRPPEHQRQNPGTKGRTRSKRLRGRAHDCDRTTHPSSIYHDSERGLPCELVERVSKTEIIFLVLRLRVPTLAAFQYLEHRRAFPRRRAAKLSVGVFWVWLPGKVRRFFRPSRSTTSGYISSLPGVGVGETWGDLVESHQNARADGAAGLTEAEGPPRRGPSGG